MRSHKAFAAAVAALALLGVFGSSVAQAQTEEHLKPFRLYLGAFFPSDGDTSDRIGGTQFSWGASYDFPNKKPSPGTAAIYFDGMWASDDLYHSPLNGNQEIKFHYLGIGPEYRFYP